MLDSGIRRRSDFYSLPATCHYIGEKLLVSGVWSGSPADRAGVAANDEIVMINGKGAAGYTLGEMRAILKTNDGKDAVDLAIKNAGGERNLTIKKQFLFAQ